MQKPDEFRVTFDQNPAMLEALQGKNPGDEVIAEIHATIKAKDAEGVDLIAEAVIPDGYEVDEDASEAGKPAGPIGPTSTGAIPTPLAMMIRRKKTTA